MGIKKKCPEFENHERWLVSYADMVTLLFAVFVVLYAIQVAGQKQEKKVAGSMQESFNSPLEDIPVDRRVGPMEAGYGIFDHFKGESVHPPLIQKYPTEKAKIRIIDDEMLHTKTKIEERFYGEQKFRENDPGNARIVNIHRTTKGFKLELTARHFYAAGSTEVIKGARKELDVVIELLKELGRPVTVEGHTDSTKASGPYDNWALSTLRATNVIRYMISKHGFPATRLSAAGYADMQPIAHNGTESGRVLNRRIEFHVEYDSD